MELKSANVDAAAAPSSGFNRTFMELKYYYLLYLISCAGGLIVPLWN